jgi:hypothetical protein
MGDENAVDLSEDVMELSSILKTVDGTAFAYSQLDCISKKIGSVKVLEAYVHLQKINMQTI